MGRTKGPDSNAKKATQTKGFFGARERRRDLPPLAAAAPHGLTFADDGGLLHARQAPA
jgi:hypothetical protein